MQKQLKNRLAEAIDVTIAAFLATGTPTAREVADAVLESHEQLVHGVVEELAIRQVREMVYRRMKRVVELSAQSGEQIILPFDLEDIPSAISFVDETEEDSEDEESKVRYISLARATERHIASYEEILSANIEHASKHLKAIRILHEALAPIFKENPEITVADACDVFSQQEATAQ